MSLLRRFWFRGVVVLFVMGLAVQLVPYGRNHTNPPKIAEPPWDSPETRALARRACFDCHSNETQWPAYASVAPASWLVQRDVDAGRAALNFSEWQRPQKEAHEAAEKVQEGEMPLAVYTMMHPEARLTATERSALAQGLAKTLQGARRERLQH
jgi:mono/diheme cytochrome c family protein